MSSLSASTMPRRVLVTGASGYIGSSLVKYLLVQGYCVRGTLRKTEMSNESETNVLKAMPNASKYLELVPLELEGPQNEFDKVMHDVDWVFHVASPVNMNKIKDEQTIVGPAVKGTLNMLHAANSAPTVTKFVLTSSIAAIVSGTNTTYTEEDWATADDPRINAYFKSKVLAERAAWEFMNDATRTFTLSVLNPGIVVGPVPSPNAKSTSAIIARAFQGGVSLNIFLPLVDIRDVVRAYVRAAQVPEAAGKRFILCQSDGGELFMPEICSPLEREFGPMGYDINTAVAPKWIVWFLSWIDAEVAGMNPMIDCSRFHLDNSRSRDILELDYTPIEQTLIDGGHSLIENGIVPKKPDYTDRIQEAAK